LTKAGTILLFLFGLLLCRSQNSPGAAVKGISGHYLPEIDSLKDLLKNKHGDTVYIDLLLLIGDKYLNSLPDSAFRYYDLARVSSSEKIQAAKFKKDHDTLSELVLRKQLAISLGDLGYIADARTNYKEALKFHTAALKISEELHDDRQTAISYNNLGLLYDYWGDPEKSIFYYTKSLAIKEKIKDKKGLAYTYGNLAFIYNSLGQSSKAMELQNKSLQLRQEIGDKKGVSLSLNNLAVLYHEQGDLDKALELFNASLKIREEISHIQGQAICGNNIGEVLALRHQFDEALAHFEKSLALFKEIKDKKGTASSLNNIGSTWFAKGDQVKGIDYCIQSISLREELNDPVTLSTSLNNTGRLFREKKEFRKALPYCLRSYEIRRKLNYPKEIVYAAENAYRIYTGLKQKDSAYKFLSTAINLQGVRLSNSYYTLSEKEKALFAATMEDDLMFYYDFASHYGNEKKEIIDTACNLILRHKGLALKSSTAMRAAILSGKDSILINQYENWREIKKQIGKLFESGKDFKQLENKANELEKELVKGSALFSDLNKTKDLDWKKVKKSLKPGEAAIEFVHFKSEIDTTHPVIYAAFVIKPESAHPEMIPLCAESDIMKILGIFQGNNTDVIDKTYGTRQEAKSALYEKIWGPLKESLRQVKTIYYSPSGLLHKISFAAIGNGVNTFLCDNYDLNRVGGIGQIGSSDPVNYNDNDDFLLVGGINYNSDNTKRELWKFLPGTLGETQDIYNLLKEKKLHEKIYTSMNASEENLKSDLSKAAILHVSTHGFFFPDPETEKDVASAEQPDSKERSLEKYSGTTNYAIWSFVKNKDPLMRSGLVLAGANDVWDRDPLKEGEDGILTAKEVADLDLRKVKLVVLSACETGLGDIKGSEGVYGLQRSFKMAGAKYIIMSLWQVPDKETSEFMKLFYSKLTLTKEIKKAFNEAQKEMRRKYDPYYWAAFTLLE
jgi:CHAT domain-containing protein/tetratricopeptide (TPR) repeat protein